MFLSLVRGAVLLAALALAAPLCAQVPDAPAFGPPADTTVLRLTDLIGQTASASPALTARRAGADALATRAARDGALPEPTVALTAFPLPFATARGAQIVQLRAEQMVPWMIGTGTGAEVVQRIATPMVGGLVTSTVHTLVMIPALYAVIRGRRLRRALPEDSGTALVRP